MSYFSFLAIFLGIPLVVLFSVTYFDIRSGRFLPESFKAWSPRIVILLHVCLALFYTTPWDNYLVATGVWNYDPKLVTGFTLGWVPVEEYTFFILQTVLTGLWLYFLARRLPGAVIRQPPARWKFPWKIFSLSAILWLAAAFALISGYQLATYLSLILIWAVPPLMIQLAFGADILLNRWKLILLALASITLYLSFADSLAIHSGTWTINPSLSLNILLGGILPLEEFVFFLATNMLIVFGIALALAPESRTRIDLFRKNITWTRILNFPRRLLN